ncbi:unnamed protein product [Lactuca saligna]|uniref:Uncharacterized protein n=1 Tax=Lactuca saligna TaxID=75948 RepID=A0AA36A3W9_LACSI|nr:unnamed protein product [Lactuca saligna]
MDENNTPRVTGDSNNVSDVIPIESETRFTVVQEKKKEGSSGSIPCPLLKCIVKGKSQKCPIKFLGFVDLVPSHLAAYMGYNIGMKCLCHNIEVIERRRDDRINFHKNFVMLVHLALESKEGEMIGLTSTTPSLSDKRCDTTTIAANHSQKSTRREETLDCRNRMSYWSRNFIDRDITMDVSSYN